MHKISKLHNLYSQEEELELLKNIPENQTYLWKYWGEFVSMSLENKKSQVFLSWVYDVMKTIIRHTWLKTIESFDDIWFLFNELKNLKYQRNWSSVTYNTYRKNLNSYFLHLIRMKYINDNPIHRIQKSKEADKSQPITNIEDIWVLIKLLEKWETMEELRDCLYFKLAILTCARPVELLNLKIGSLFDNRSKVRISWAKQNSKERIYSIKSIENNILRYIISVSKAWRNKELNDNLFLSVSKKWKPLTTNWLNKLYQRISKKTWFKITTYMIRRYGATMMYKRWLWPNEMMDFLWHTRWSTTKWYIQNSEEFTRKGTEIMSSIFW